jgi:hypothetical protein
MLRSNPNRHQRPRKREKAKPRTKSPLKLRALDWLLSNDKTMKAILANWKTTLLGTATLFGGLATIANTLADGWQSGDLELITASGTAVTAGAAMIFARDADKSSQDSGVR